MNNDRDNATAETTPLTWTRKKELGSEGMTHRTAVTIDGAEHAFTVDSPGKGYWVARGWTNGDMDLYREDRTMRGAKDQVQAYVDQLTRQAAERKADAEAAPDVTGTLPDGRAFTADHKTAPVYAIDEAAEHLTHMADQLGNYAPTVVERAAKSMRQFGWHLRRRCTCPTPSHRMSCGEGGRVQVVR